MGESYRHALTDPDVSPFKRPYRSTKEVSLACHLSCHYILTVGPVKIPDTI